MMWNQRAIGLDRKDGTVASRVQRLLKRRQNAPGALVAIHREIDRPAHPITRIAFIIEFDFVQHEMLTMIDDAVCPGH